MWQRHDLGEDELCAFEASGLRLGGSWQWSPDRVEWFPSSTLSISRGVFSLSEEWQLAAYVTDQNERLGLAPSTGSLLSRWGSRRAAYPEAAGPADFGTVAGPKAKKRTQRWRARWGAKIATVRFREELPPGEARSKAGHQIGVEKRD